MLKNISVNDAPACARKGYNIIKDILYKFTAQFDIFDLNELRRIKEARADREYQKMYDDLPPKERRQLKSDEAFLKHAFAKIK